MVEAVSLLIVLLGSLIITRVATIALALTGLTEQSARFQARSALTGAGFTTSESERVVNHPVRRRIIMTLMIVGNTGLVLVASFTILLLGGAGSTGLAQRWSGLAILVGGLLVLVLAARSHHVERWLARGIERMLMRGTEVATRDYANLMRLGGEYRIAELHLDEGDWMAGATLGELGLAEEGVLVLGVIRSDGSYVGAPVRDTELRAHDIALLYGRRESIAALDDRRRGIGGQLEHAEAVGRQKEVLADQRRTERRAEREEAEARTGSDTRELGADSGSGDPGHPPTPSGGDPRRGG